MTVRPCPADCEHLVDEQDLRLEVRRDRKRKPHRHAARVALDRSVEKALDLGEGDDLVEAAPDLRPAHPEDGAVQIDVLAAGQLGMEPCSDLEQRSDPTGHIRVAACGLGDAREDLQQRGLACAVVPDQADDFALVDRQRDVAQRPQRRVDTRRRAAHDSL